MSQTAPFMSAKWAASLQAEGQSSYLVEPVGLRGGIGFLTSGLPLGPEPVFEFMLLTIGGRTVSIDKVFISCVASLYYNVGGSVSVLHLTRTGVLNGLDPARLLASDMNLNDPAARGVGRPQSAHMAREQFQEQLPARQ